MKFRSERICFVVAVLLWAAALTRLPSLAKSTTWHLYDWSHSVPKDSWDAAKFDQHSWVFASELRPAPSPDQTETRTYLDGSATRLGAALKEVRRQLQNGDRLIVYTDGATTDALPLLEADSDWSRIRVEWESVARKPRIVSWDAPTEWPETDRIEITVRLTDADLNRGTLWVADTQFPNVLQSSEVFPYGDQTLLVSLVAPGAREKGLQVRLRWQEGDFEDQKLVPIAATGKLWWWSPHRNWRMRLQNLGLLRDPTAIAPEPGEVVLGTPRSVEESDLRQWLADGHVVLFAGSRLEDWAGLEQHRQVLRPAPPAGRSLKILLDHSGSMGAVGDSRAPLDSAREWIFRFASAWPQEAGFLVYPFAARAEPPLDPRVPADRKRLSAMLPSGPTALAASLRSIAERTNVPGPWILLSDGQASTPPEGWEPLIRPLKAGSSSVICVPIGPEADLETLQEIGEIRSTDLEASLQSRLQDAASVGLEELAGISAAQSSRWSLSIEWPVEAHDRMQEAPGSEILYKDSSGGVTAALQLEGPGLLLGLNSTDVETIVGVFGEVARQQKQAPKLEWRDGALWLRGEGTGWSYSVLDPQEDAEGADKHGFFQPWDADLWWAPLETEVDSVRIHGPQGLQFWWRLDQQEEFRTNAEAWSVWLEAQQGLRRHDSWQPLLLLGALGATTLALGLRQRRPTVGD